MARIDKRALTRLEIVQEASKQFIENGYSNTAIKTICKELQMSPGNVTFYFPAKENMLAELVDLLCSFQWKMMEEEAEEGISSVLAICLELASMAAMCEEDEVAKDFYLSAYTSPICLEIIRRNDAARAKAVFREYCPDWDDEHYAEAETLVSGIEYATLMTTGDSAPLPVRIEGALNSILTTYNIPEEIRKVKIEKVLGMDYQKIARRVLSEFKRFIEQTNEKALEELINARKRK